MISTLIMIYFVPMIIVIICVLLLDLLRIERKDEAGFYLSLVPAVNIVLAVILPFVLLAGIAKKIGKSSLFRSKW